MLLGKETRVYDSGWSCAMATVLPTIHYTYSSLTPTYVPTTLSHLGLHEAPHFIMSVHNDKGLTRLLTYATEAIASNDKSVSSIIHGNFA